MKQFGGISSLIVGTVLMTASLLEFSGCISIATHEAQMKKCRLVVQEADQLRNELVEAETKNKELEGKLEDQSERVESLENKVSEVRNTYDELVQDLKDEIEKGLVGIQTTKHGLTITLGEKILFKSGQTEVQKNGKKILARIARSLQSVKNSFIQVEGHADAGLPGKNLSKKFPSNWEMSAARSGAVVRFLQHQGVNPNNLILVAYGENRPVADNKTPLGRQKNRRVEITLISKKLFTRTQGK